MDIASIMATSAAKAIIIAVLVFIAHKWSKGDFDKPLKNLKQLGKEYGIVTMLLIVVWWIMTPSGMPDDVIAVWLLGTIGLIPYIIIMGALTAYIIWRLKVTIVIYRKK